MTAEWERSTGGSGARALDPGELGGRTEGSGSLGPVRRENCLKELGNPKERDRDGPRLCLPGNCLGVTGRKQGPSVAERTVRKVAGWRAKEGFGVGVGEVGRDWYPAWAGLWVGGIGCMDGERGWPCGGGGVRAP